MSTRVFIESVALVKEYKQLACDVFFKNARIERILKGIAIVEIDEIMKCATSYIGNFND